MDQIALTGSFVQQFGQESFTFFIGQQDSRYGIVSAGSWDTVLPFCFDEIRMDRGNRIIAQHGGEQHVYRIVLTHHSVHAVREDASLWSANRFAICLPA